MNSKLEINVVSTSRPPLDIRVGVKQPYGSVIAYKGNLPDASVVQWGNPTEAHVRVYLSRNAYSQMMAHARSGIRGSQRFEVGGILLGQPFSGSDDEISDVHVIEAIPDEYGISRPSTFNFTHESWAALLKEKEERFPDLRIVGWYHSHPDYGVFYSGTDTHSQKTYFSSPWRVGIVVDPVRDEGGLFAVSPKTGEVVQLPGFYEAVGPTGESWVTFKNFAKSPSPVAAKVLGDVSVQSATTSLLNATYTPTVPHPQKNGMLAAFGVLCALSLLGLVLLVQMRLEMNDLRAEIKSSGSSLVIDANETALPLELDDQLSKYRSAPQFGPSKRLVDSTPTPADSWGSFRSHIISRLTPGEGPTQ